jgi:hypothetical protein
LGAIENWTTPAVHFRRKKIKIFEMTFEKESRPGGGGVRLSGLRIAVDNRNQSITKTNNLNSNSFQVSEELRQIFRRMSSERVCGKCNVAYYVDESGSLLVRSRGCP